MNDILEDINEKRTRKKRSLKSDPITRSFKCGCGKSYLSYPALYTHIKQKHDGEAPEGSTKQVKVRGRPVNKRSQKNNPLNSNWNKDFNKEFLSYLKYLESSQPKT